MKKYRRVVAFALILALLVLTLPASAYDGAIDQGKDHASETGMYRYDIDIYLYNPCNANDMDKDAVYLLWFDFNYTTDNGYGKSATYRLDMSWKKDLKRNLNSEILKANFIRPNDNACMTRFSVWVPGIVNDVKVFLNMDGGERLAFTVESIWLGGYRINTGTDYVSSAYYDSEAKINCFVPQAAITGESTDAPVRDQYGGAFSASSIEKALEAANTGDYRMFYHYNFGQKPKNK